MSRYEFDVIPEDFLYIIYYAAFYAGDIRDDCSAFEILLISFNPFLNEFRV